MIGNAWVYALSIGVYCTAWTYFGSVGRAATGGVWFLPIYLGPMLAMILAWVVLRKMIRIARSYRITSIADFIASRHGKSPLLAGLVTLIAVVGMANETNRLVGAYRVEPDTKLVEAAKAGAHIATMPFKVFEQLFKHPLTDRGLEAFLKDWEKARESLGDIVEAIPQSGTRKMGS